MDELDRATKDSLFVLLVTWNPFTNRCQIMVNSQMQPALAQEEWREELIGALVSHLRSMAKPQDDWPANVKRLRLDGET